MVNPDFAVRPFHTAGDIHQAAKIPSQDDIWLCLFYSFDFVIHQAGGNLGVFDTESATESAADFGVMDFIDIQPAMPLQQFPWLCTYSQFSQAGTGIVVADFFACRRAEMFKR